MPAAHPERAEPLLEHAVRRARPSAHPARRRVPQQQDRRQGEPPAAGPARHHDRQSAELAAASRHRLSVPLPLRDPPAALLRHFFRPRPRPAAPLGHDAGTELERLAGSLTLQCSMTCYYYIMAIRHLSIDLYCPFKLT